MYIKWNSGDKTLQAITANNLLKIINIPIVKYYYKHILDTNSLKCTFNGDVTKNINNNIVPEGEVTVTCSGTRVEKGHTYKQHINFNIKIICNFSQGGKLNGDYFFSHSDDNNRIESILYTSMNDNHIRHKLLTIYNGDDEEDNGIDNDNNDVYYDCEIITYDNGIIVEQIRFGCDLGTFDIGNIDNAKYILRNYNKLSKYKLYSSTIINYNLGTSNYVDYTWPSTNHVISWDPSIGQDIFQYYKKYNADGKLTLLLYQNGIDINVKTVKSSHEISEHYNVMNNNTGNNIGSYLGHYQINGIPELSNVNLVPFRGESRRQLNLVNNTIIINYHENGSLKLIYVISRHVSKRYEFNEQGQLITNEHT